MHWIQSIREYLKISQKELAGYLGVSPHTLQSVELGRRRLSLDRLRPAMTIFQAIKAPHAHRPVVEPSLANDQHTRRKRFHRQCHRKLNRCEYKLEDMQRSHAAAIDRLGIYQYLAETLTGEEDLARRRWTQRKIEETMQQIKDNDVSAQDLLSLEIAALKGVTRTLEESSNSYEADIKGDGNLGQENGN